MHHTQNVLAQIQQQQEISQEDIYTDQVNFEVPNSSKQPQTTIAYNVKVSKPDQRRGGHDQDQIFKSLEVENMFKGVNGRVDREETMAQLQKMK